MKDNIRSSIDQLSPAERLILAQWYDTPSYKALRKLVDIERMELAKDHVDQIDILQVRYLSGQTSSLRRLIEQLANLYKDHLKNEEKTQKHNKR